jgi:hypothetical protein
MQTTQSADLEMIARNGGPFSRVKARIPTYLTDLRENPTWLAMFLLARLMPARKAHWLAADYPDHYSELPTIFAYVSCAAAVQGLRQDGVFTGLTIPKAICADIVGFAARNTCFGNFDRKMEFFATEHAEAEQRYGRSILSGHYFEKVLNCPAAVSVQRDPLLFDIAAHYLGAKAHVITTRIWWSFPTLQASEADKKLASIGRYHFDLDDWRMLKFFFYLTDVDTGTGPHVYVRDSHKRRMLRHQLTLFVGHPAEEVVGYYGKDRPITILGPAGTGFVEDPFGFHMGTVAERGPRLMMEVGFGISPPSRRRFHGEPIVRNVQSPESGSPSLQGYRDGVWETANLRKNRSA